jgi:hypothetical protein
MNTLREMTVRIGHRDTQRNQRYRSNAGPKGEIINRSSRGRANARPALTFIPVRITEGKSAVSHSSGSERDQSRIRAIETHYAGHRFRSRLEARWAVFFDALGIKWHYEEEGYELPSGRYLPDFRLSNATAFPDLDLHVEVKGRLDRAGLIRLAQCAYELPAPEQGIAFVVPKLLVLGEIPAPGFMAASHVRIDVPNPSPEGDGHIGFQSVYFKEYATANPRHLVWPHGEAVPFKLAWLPKIDDSEAGKLADWLINETREASIFSDSAVDGAYRAARSARFEFGESGA